MWIGRLDKKEIIAYVGAGGMAFWLFLSRLFGTPLTARPNLQVAMLFVIGGLALFVLYRVRQMRLAGDVVCTTRQGVWIKSGRRIDLYAYSEIEDVFWKTSNRNAAVKIKGRERPFYIAQIFRRLSDFEEFESEVQSRKQAAGGQSLLPPPNDGSWTHRWRSRL
ncbi:MAG: hypothetical protein O7D91_02425 [Planctomycetota bacterium]|nr:hypothetical protein [Planctomycetota bacterium]